MLIAIIRPNSGHVWWHGQSSVIIRFLISLESMSYKNQFYFYSYSEGKGLTHEDERSYSGQIIADEEEADIYSQSLFVRGSVVFGTDLGSDARPEPVGVFSMMEIKGD